MKKIFVILGRFFFSFSTVLSSIYGYGQDTNENRTETKNELEKFEVGIHYSRLSLRSFDPTFTKEFRSQYFPGTPFVQAKSSQDSGIGMRFTYNLNNNVGVESEVNWYFQKDFIVERPLLNRSPYPGGQKLQIIAGPKIGFRKKAFGVFGKARPGLMHFVSYPVITSIQQVPPGQPFFVGQTPRRATFFNVDVGGVIEYYAKKRHIIRFDIGDTMIRYSAQQPKEINPMFWRHNLQMGLGYGFRF